MSRFAEGAPCCNRQRAAWSGFQSSAAGRTSPPNKAEKKTRWIWSDRRPWWAKRTWRSRLERAIEARETQVIWLRIDPRLKSLHADPRFKTLAARLGL